MINLSTGAFYERSATQIGSLRARAESLQEQIASGQRLERSSDDPVAAARLRMLDREERISSVDTRNSQTAENNLKFADQAFSQVATMISRARELALLAASATTPELAMEIYTASVLAIDPDHPAERAYLDLLGARLNLPAELTAEIRRTAGEVQG